MLVRELRERPRSWTDHINALERHRWLLPLHVIEWFFQWISYAFSRWAFLEVIEYMGVLSVLFGVISYYREAPDRQKQKHYQAWQVINTAQGKGGSGGRIEALQELNADKVPLVGVDVSNAFLQGLTLRRASLVRANFEDADMRDCNLESADLEFATLHSANLRRGNLRNAKLNDAGMEDADLVGATLENADLSHVNLKDADLRAADLRNIRWQDIASISSANIYNVRNPPVGFTAWALSHGAVSKPGDD
jgi:hypothetical protein